MQPRGEAEAAAGAEALVLMVVNAAQARSVLFGAGALAALAPGATVILMATCPPGEVEGDRRGGHRDRPAFHRRAGLWRRQRRAQRDPDDRGRRAGRQFWCGRSPLDALGDKVFHVGERAGQGATVKPSTSCSCGVHIAVAAEALSLAEKAGIDGRLLFEISKVRPPVLDARGSRAFACTSPIRSS